MVGWVVVLIGCVSFPVGWNIGRLGGIVDIALSCATIVAGLALVSQSVSSLESYLKIGLPSIHNGEQHTVVHEVAAVMKDVDDGGWREAFAAIEKIEELGKQHGLPPLH